eukprot:TRINITY_DN29572_c0_g1_i1.p1 TRINITY_DN29572_c0_g1~~TRINITY_DN29572_c0_g1_i1.p1  ORF type:complete len:385 (+),score=35.53 TRINITY_DN29572_c0_g1_i1:65-1156(+)
MSPPQLRLQTLLRSISAGTVAVYLSGGRLERRPSLTAVTRSHALAHAVACEARPGDKADVWSSYKADYRGQITPSRAVRTARPAGHPMPPVDLQGGPFRSRWLRVHHGASVADVTEALAQAEDGASSAIYCGLPDDLSTAGPLVAALRQRGFKFHHFHEGDASAPNELIYYRWYGKGADMVPSYSTALEGIGVLVLSPNQDEVLLAWEYGHWKMITGNVDAKESMADTVRREVREEVGLELTDSVPMQMIGGWQEARSRDRSVNNIFCTFAVTAKSKEVKVDGHEIHDARWFPLASMPTFQDDINAPKVQSKPFSLEWDMGAPGKNFISRSIPRFLDVLKQGRGLRVEPRDTSLTSSTRDFFS